MRVPCYLNEEVSFHNIQRLQLSDGSYAIEGRELRRLIQYGEAYVGAGSPLDQVGKTSSITTFKNNTAKSAGPLAAVLSQGRLVDVAGNVNNNDSGDMELQADEYPATNVLDDEIDKFGEDDAKVILGMF